MVGMVVYVVGDVGYNSDSYHCILESNNNIVEATFLEFITLASLKFSTFDNSVMFLILM